MTSPRFSPTRLFLQVLAIVFFVEAGVMLLLPTIVPQWLPGPLQALADSSLLTVLSFPLLWWVILRPLHRTAVEERTKAEAVCAATPDGIITFNERGVIQSFNRAAEQLFGYSASEVIGDDLEVLIPRHLLVQQSGTESEARPRLLSGTVKIAGRRKDGSEAPLIVSLSETRAPGGPIHTAVVRAPVDREREEMRAEQMAALARMGAALAHRLRNPLTSIKMLLQAGNRPDEPLALDREDLRIMEEEVRRMERSLRMFLDFARPPKADRRRRRLAPLVADAIAGLAPRAAQTGVTIDFPDAQSGLEALLDGEQTLEMLQQLLQNAVEAAPPNGRIEVGLRDAGGAQIELSIRDPGPGISSDLLPRLFQPFATTKARGVGLGLVIARRIAEVHGGTLTGRNESGGGACFIVRLPNGAGTGPSGDGRPPEERSP